MPIAREHEARLSRRFASALVVACLVLGIVPTSALAAIPAPSVVAPSAVLMTMDGTPLWFRRADSQRRVASTIKMLNALVVRERASLDETVVVTRKAAAIEDGDVGLVAGQQLTVRKLLEIMLVASGNDAAEALAIHVGATEARFVALMNAKAKQLGLANTRATDPHGLGKREYSTARDLSVLGRRVMADPWLRRIVNMRSVVVPRPGGKRTILRSTYHLLGGYPGIEGVKTGYTIPAGYCFVGAARRGNVELVGVVLGARSNADRFVQMRKLLDWGFAHVHVRELVSETTTFSVPATSAEETTTVAVHPARTVSKALLDGSEPITLSVRTAPPAQLPIVAGQTLGTLELRLGTTLLATVPLLALADVSPPETPTALVAARWQRVASVR